MLSTSSSSKEEKEEKESRAREGENASETFLAAEISLRAIRMAREADLPRKLIDQFKYCVRCGLPKEKRSERKEEEREEETNTTTTANTTKDRHNNNNNNNNNDEFPNVHAEKVVDVYVSERVSRAETRAEEKSVGRVVVVLIGKEERMR